MKREGRERRDGDENRRVAAEEVRESARETRTRVEKRENNISQPSTVFNG